ncbi:MAG: hypothetical protein PF690_08475 [Deltaproteobacteria bacterium]|jgi:L-ascorbate metabolism protein UlaG (beta-lactamase superfamily)|nr:hypothetical protein [Deltaproteobacteria bacterium]
MELRCFSHSSFLITLDSGVTACSFVNPKQAVPMHYNTFDDVNAEPLEFKNRLENNHETKRINCQVLEFGQEINLP